MKNNWKSISAVLLILAGTARAGASTTDSVGKPSVGKEIIANTTAVQVKGEKVFVNLLNLDENAVTVKVLDDKNRVLYLKNFRNKTLVEKAFNFEKAYKGTYSVVVNDGETIYAVSVEVTS